VTTSYDRILLRWVPLAALLAIAMAVGLSFGPHPFGYHGWPKAPAPRSVDRVVRVAPERGPITVARREPADRSTSRKTGSAAHDETAHPRRAVHAERPAHPSRRSSRSHDGKGRDAERPPAPVQTPEPPRNDPIPETPNGVPVAQGPDRIPDAAEAKPDVEPVTPPPSSVEVRDRDEYDELDFHEEGGRGHGHGQRHGHGTATATTAVTEPLARG
jgi:hypothetical protein